MPKKEEGDSEKSEIAPESETIDKEGMEKKEEDEFMESVLGMMDDILKPL